MNALHAAALLTETAAAGSAVLLTRRRAEHRPAAVALVTFALADGARLLTVPATTPARVYLDGAIVLAQQAVLPALAVASCSAPGQQLRAVAPIVGAWAVASVVLGALYPSPLVTGAGLARVYLAADLAGLFVTVASLVRWARARAPASTSQGVALLLAAVDVAMLVAPLSPWRLGLFGRYDAQEFALVSVFGFITLCQGVLCLLPK